MKNYVLVHQLLNLVEELEKENKGKELGLSDFSGYLINSLSQLTPPVTSLDVRFGNQEIKIQELAYQIDNAIGRLLVYMSRYA
jgi:hypothetical protein